MDVNQGGLRSYAQLELLALADSVTRFVASDSDSMIELISVQSDATRRDLYWWDLYSDDVLYIGSFSDARLLRSEFGGAFAVIEGDSAYVFDALTTALIDVWQVDPGPYPVALAEDGACMVSTWELGLIRSCRAGAGEAIVHWGAQVEDAPRDRVFLALDGRSVAQGHRVFSFALDDAGTKLVRDCTLRGKIATYLGSGSRLVSIEGDEIRAHNADDCSAIGLELQLGDSSRLLGGITPAFVASETDERAWVVSGGWAFQLELREAGLTVTGAWAADRALARREESSLAAGGDLLALSAKAQSWMVSELGPGSPRRHLIEAAQPENWPERLGLHLGPDGKIVR
jgi:hypothetical protein